ncbi:hypothetical protein ACQ86G_01005 [Roseateles chitinivorans]|uniref:hypothetical protein n=1 Tax=Roseateles chitinivorans TaxID=2917965 RepID=UPI003D6640DA
MTGRVDKWVSEGGAFDRYVSSRATGSSQDTASTAFLQPFPTSMNTANSDQPSLPMRSAEGPAVAVPAPSNTRVAKPRHTDESATAVPVEDANDADLVQAPVTAEDPMASAASVEDGNQPAGAASAGERGAEPAFEQAEQPECRQIRRDGTEEDCNQSAVWPWMIAGSGILLAGGAAASSRGSDSHASAAAPPPPPAPPAPVLPAAPHLSTSSGKDTIDGAGHVDVALAAPGASWVYRLDGDDTWHAGQGSRIDADTLSRGVHAVMVAQLDDQGRRGDVATLAVRVHDEVLAPTLTLAHDNGSSASDGLTNDGTVLVSGLTTGATWFYRVNGATDWVEGKDGQVPAGALVAGQNRVEAYQVDAGGEHGPLTSLTVTLDLTPPAAPLLQTSNGTDLLNAHDFINVSGIEGGASWRFRVNGQGDWIEGHDGRIPADALAAGENHVDVVQVDAAGNVGAAATLTVRQDLEAPDPLQAHVEGGHGNLVSLQGAIVLDNIEAGATWKYRINGENDWHVGDGSQLSANHLLEGRNDVTLMQTDSTGHESAATLITVTRDSIAPDRPDLVTSNGLPLINAQGSLLVHRLEDAATWEYRIDGGDWLVGHGATLGAAALHEGGQTVDVRQSDVAGNVSEVDSLAVTLDSTPPDAVMSAARTQDGAMALNHLINATGYVSIDNLEQDASWEYKVNGDDHWRHGGGHQLSSRVLDEGENSVQIRQIDAAGNAGEATTTLVDLDATAPDTPTLTSSTGKWLMNASGYVQIGHVEPGAQLTVKLDGRVIQPGGTPGHDQFQGFQYGEGTHSVESYVTDAAGNVSRSAVASFTVDVTSPDAPTLYLSDGRINDLSDHVDVLDLEWGATWWYRVDKKGDWIQGSGSQIAGSAFVNTSASTESHTVQVHQVDAVGNQSVDRNFALWSDIPPPAGV